jgi:hypothetical protein
MNRDARRPPSPDVTMLSTIVGVGDGRSADQERWTPDERAQHLAIRRAGPTPHIARMRSPSVCKFCNTLLQRLKPAVDECTDEDLAAVGRDLEVMREIVLLFRRVFAAMFDYFPNEIKPTTEDVLAMLFRLAKWFVWADLSLRRSGHGERIEYCLTETLRGLQADFNENVEQELAAAGPEISAAVENCFQKLTVAVAP